MAIIDPPSEAETLGAETTASGRYKQRLVVHVLWHPNFRKTADSRGGKEYAEHLYSILTRDIEDPLSRGIGIPVYFRTSTDEAGSPPPAIELDDALHTVIVALVDAEMVVADGWGDYVAGLDRAVRDANARHGDRRHRLLPVMISQNAFNLDEHLLKKHFIRLADVREGARLTALSISVAHELCRVLKDVPSADYSAAAGKGGPAPAADDDRIMIFISHTKVGNSGAILDGVRKALKDNGADGDDEHLADEILRYFGAHADDDPDRVSFDRFTSSARAGAEADLLARLREHFLAFSKIDRGKAIAEAVRDYIQRDLQLNTFFDAHEILPGEDFAETISRSIDRSALLIVQTDAYASRIWCQLEVLLAKRNLRPVLVVNAVRSGEKRAFPYLGNVPTIRFAGAARPNYPEIISQMLLEVLRTIHFKQHFDDLAALYQIPDDIECLTLSPELLTFIDLRRKNNPVKRFVYPDPPLGDDELDLLRGLDKDITVTTPIFLLGTNAKSTEQGAPETTATAGPTPKLHGMTVGISISESPDLPRLGMGKAHLDEANAGFSRYLLASGAALAYGGDFRPGGYTEQLLDLVRMHNAEAKEGRPKSRLKWYLAWPLHLAIKAEALARYKDVCEFYRVPPPPDLGVAPATDPGPPKTPEDRYVRARCFTAMRERMHRGADGARAIEARLLLGGPTFGFAGRYPGLVEEAYLAIRDGIPLYLIGGFGGCARVVIQALLKSNPRRQVVDDAVTVVLDPLPRPDGVPEELTEDYQCRLTPGYPELIDVYAQKHANGPDADRISYTTVVQTFQNAGLAGLKNGLNDEENLRLFTTPFVVEMIQLTLLGLSRLGRV